MHRAALAALGLDDWHYQRLPVPPELLEQAVRALPAAGFVGANVTLPHKEAALAVADTSSDPARRAGAANTLTFGPDGVIHADNTDIGAVAAVLPESVGSGLVLGAGGSARAAVIALLDAGADVRVHNRTVERAEALAADLAVAVARDTSPRGGDVLVNCTTLGLADADPAPAAPAGFGLVVDLVYREGPTALAQQARDAGVPVVDGLEILARQGALSLAGWTGRQPSLDVMLAAARA